MCLHSLNVQCVRVVFNNHYIGGRPEVSRDMRI